MKVAILGAGAGGASAVVELTQAGHELRLWNRSAAAVEGFRTKGGVTHGGVFGEGFTPVTAVTTDLRTATDGADVLLVCLPTLAHGPLAQALLASGVTSIPTVLNPGHTGGALEFSQIFRSAGLNSPPIAELSTLTYVARKPSPERVVITGKAQRVRVAALPGGRAALEIASILFPGAEAAANVLTTSLSNVNMVLHPPGCILGAAWVEATHGDFTFYVQGLSDGVARVMDSLDDERRAVAAGFGVSLPSLFEEMRRIGTIEATADAGAGLAAGIRGGVANKAIKAPSSFLHRYYQEDFWYGLQPFLALAGIAGVATGTAESLMCLASSLAGPAAPAGGRSAASMGISGMQRSALLEFVTGR